MPIKDKAYWKKYNQKRKEKGYFQSNYLQRKGNSLPKDKVIKKDEEVVNYSEVVKNNPVVKSPEVVKSEVVKLEPVVKVVKTETENILQPKTKEVVKSLQPNLVVKNESLQPTETLQPNLEKRIKELELKIISLQETNQILRKDLDYWQEPINPTIELWKGRYFALEKKTNQQLSDQQETINRLKEKLREKGNQIQPSIPKEANIIPLLYDKVNKKPILYSCPDPCYQGKYCNNCEGLLAN